MTFGEDWGWGASRDESREIFDAFTEAGGNFIDTANLYSNGASETIVGELIDGRRDEFVVATKYTLNSRPEDPNGGGNHRKSMRQALHESLKRLGTDYIDVYWVHAWDFMTPVDEVMRALDDMVSAGKVLYIGISDVPAWVVAQGNTMAELRGWTPFAGLQIQYSLIERTSERELLPMAKELDLAVTAWSPLGGGMLTGKYKRGAEPPKESRFADRPRAKIFLTDKNHTIAEEVAEVAAELGATPAQVALAWVRQSHDGGVIIPIVGARTLSQIEDNMAALDVELSDDQLARLNEVSAIELGFPHQMLNSEGVLRGIHGNIVGRIDNHRSAG